MTSMHVQGRSPALRSCLDQWATRRMTSSFYNERQSAVGWGAGVPVSKVWKERTVDWIIAYLLEVALVSAVCMWFKRTGWFRLCLNLRRQWQRRCSMRWHSRGGHFRKHTIIFENRIVWGLSLKASLLSKDWNLGGGDIGRLKLHQVMWADKS